MGMWNISKHTRRFDLVLRYECGVLHDWSNRRFFRNISTAAPPKCLPSVKFRSLPVGMNSILQFMKFSKMCYMQIKKALDWFSHWIRPTNYFRDLPNYFRSWYRDDSIVIPGLNSYFLRQIFVRITGPSRPKVRFWSACDSKSLATKNVNIFQNV